MLIVNKLICCCGTLPDKYISALKYSHINMSRAVGEKEYKKGSYFKVSYFFVER